MTDLFRQRELLGRAELNEADRRLELLDAHHVGKVHGRQGVFTGLELWIDATRTWLVIEPGGAYSMCGELALLTQQVCIRAPRSVGTHLVWIDATGHVAARPASVGRVGSETFLGQANTAIRPGVPSETVWDPPPDTAGRTQIAEPIQPYVASGKGTIGLRNINIDPPGQTLSHQVDTRNGGFENPPLYFATMAFSGVIPEFVLEQITGWYTAICDPTAVGFRLSLHVLADSGLLESLQVFARYSDFLSFDIAWIGVDPRRPGVAPIDLACTSGAVFATVSRDTPIPSF